jgi:NADPH-dependent curcumin reductase CurA
MATLAPKTFRRWVYAKPMTDGSLTLDQFALEEAPTPEPAEGQALVKVKLLNIHSATRSRLASGAIALGGTDPFSYACAEVVRSRDPAFREGDVIACQAGWQEYQLISSQDASIGYGRATELTAALNRTNSQWCYVFRPEMTRMWPPEVLMDVFGTSGMTAYFGLRECGPIMPRDAVLAAGASGSVGSMAAQLAKKAGARVVGLAGGAERCRWVVETLRIDACLDYRADDFLAQLQAAFPNGVDVFSDGVGGDLTTRVVQTLMNPNSRLFAYGTSAAYYAEETPAPPSAPGGQRKTTRQQFVPAEAEPAIAAKNIKVEAWIVHDFYHERITAENDLSRLLLSGALKPVHAIVEGFEKLPEAVVSLYRQPHAGKLQVRFG